MPQASGIPSPSNIEIIVQFANLAICDIVSSSPPLFFYSLLRTKPSLASEHSRCRAICGDLEGFLWL